MGGFNSFDEIGGVISAYKNVGNTTQAWLHLGVSFTIGALSGGLSMNGVGAVASSGINAALSGSGKLAAQLIDYHYDNVDINVSAIIRETVIGAISNTEAGAGNKATTALGKGTVKKTFKKFKAVNQKRSKNRSKIL